MQQLWLKLTALSSDFFWWMEMGLSVVIALLVWWLYHRLYQYFENRSKKLKKQWPYAFLKSMHIPLVCLLWFLFVCWIVQKITKHYYLLHDFKYWHLLYQLSIVLALFATLMTFITGMQKVMLIDISRNPNAKTNRTSVTAMAQLCRIVVIVLTILTILQITGIPISALLAVGSIGTLTIGLAAKDSLENYMGGAMIFFDRPFGVGDWINLPDQKIEGTVDQIGWRLTRIMGFDKRPYYIPNKIFSSNIIENPSRMTNRRIKKVIGLRYDDLEKVDLIVKDIEAMLEQHPDLDHDVTTFVSLTDLATSSVNILIYAFTKTTKWIPFQKIQQDILLQTTKIIYGHGAQCAFPTRTLDLPQPIQFESTPSH